jgi:hypothetical protein
MVATFKYLALWFVVVFLLCLDYLAVTAFYRWLRGRNFSVKDLQPRVTNIPTRVTRKRGRHSESYAPNESTSRVTTREV